MSRSNSWKIKWCPNESVFFLCKQIKNQNSGDLDQSSYQPILTFRLWADLSLHYHVPLGRQKDTGGDTLSPQIEPHEPQIDIRCPKGQVGENSLRNEWGRSRKENREGMMTLQMTETSKNGGNVPCFFIHRVHQPRLQTLTADLWWEWQYLRARLFEWVHVAFQCGLWLLGMCVHHLQ